MPLTEARPQDFSESPEILYRSLLLGTHLDLGPEGTLQLRPGCQRRVSPTRLGPCHCSGDKKTWQEVLEWSLETLGLGQVENSFRDELHLSHLLEGHCSLAYFESELPNPQGPRRALSN